MDFLASTVPAIDFAAHGSPVQSIAFDHSGQYLVTADTSRLLRAWSKAVPFFEANLRATSQKVFPTDRIRGLGFSADGAHLYVAGGDTLRAFDLLGRTEVWQYQPPRAFGFLIASPMTLSVSPAGNVLTVSDTGLVTVIDANGRILSKWWDSEAPRYAAFMSDGSGMVGVHGFCVSSWEAYTGRSLRRMLKRERIFGMAFDSLRQIMAIRTLHHVDLIDATNFQLVDRFPAPAGLPLMAFSPDGSVLALGGKEEVLMVEFATKQCVVVPLPGARVVSMAFHPSGDRLAVGCSDGVVRFWSMMPGVSLPQSQAVVAPPPIVQQADV